MPGIRSRIADTARDLYLAEGPEAFSMRRVAARVGVTAPALYRHFTGRQDLLDAVTEGGLSILEGYLRRGATGEDPLERILRVADALLRFALRHPGYFELLFISPRAGHRELPREFRRRQSRSFQVLADEVSRAMAEDAFRRADVIITALGIWSVAHGLICLHRSGRFGRDPARFRRIYRRTLRQHVEGLAR